jgi:hypothetical protein
MRTSNKSVKEIIYVSFWRTFAGQHHQLNRSNKKNSTSFKEVELWYRVPESNRYGREAGGF